MTARLSILHLNDIYEIAPVSGGRCGGLARVAELRRRLLADNPHTLVTFAGDLCSPSALGAVVVDGAPLKARHGVAVMNRLGLDVMTFGDHELNTVGLPEFLGQLAASRFRIVSSNIHDAAGAPFPGVVERHVFEFGENPEGGPRIGILGLTKPVRLPTFAFRQTDCLEAAAAQLEALAGEADFIIALTHQPLAADRELVARFPAIDLLLGGDDHHHVCLRHAGTPIVKSDSNARSVTVVEVDFQAVGGARIDARQVPITPALPEEPDTRAEIQYWLDGAFRALRAGGWEPTEVVATTDRELDGFESSVRQHRTALTDLITAAMCRVAEGTELALLCSWWLRLDDGFPPGAGITRYDLLRLFAYGDSPVHRVRVAGGLVETILDFGEARRGSGSYILTSANVVRESACWRINGAPLDRRRHYDVAMADDLLGDYLFHIDPVRTPSVVVQGEYPSLREAVVQELRRR